MLKPQGITHCILLVVPYGDNSTSRSAMTRRRRKTFDWLASSPQAALQSIAPNAQADAILLEVDRDLAGSTFTRMRGHLTFLCQSAADVPFNAAIYRSQSYAAGSEILDISAQDQYSFDDILWSTSGVARLDADAAFHTPERPIDIKAQRVLEDADSLILSIRNYSAGTSLEWYGDFRSLLRIG